MSLLWVFAACVSTCGWEIAASNAQPEVAATVEVTQVREAAECEDCPDASLLKATTPERAAFKPDLQAVSSVPALILPATHLADAGTSAFQNRQRFPPDPPPDLLPTLRI
jgi:hypothetical protein